MFVDIYLCFTVFIRFYSVYFYSFYSIVSVFMASIFRDSVARRSKVVQVYSFDAVRQSSTVLLSRRRLPVPSSPILQPLLYEEGRGAPGMLPASSFVADQPWTQFARLRGRNGLPPTRPRCIACVHARSLLGSSESGARVSSGQRHRVGIFFFVFLSQDGCHSSFTDSTWLGFCFSRREFPSRVISVLFLSLP